MTIALAPARERTEAGTALRAAISSLVATMIDGASYQLLVAVTGPSRYALAAAAGAVLGAIANFSLSRWWAFRATGTPVLGQGLRYLVGSGLTLLVLQGILWVLVDRVHLDSRTAWLPAKALAWLAFSYPFQRKLVFAETTP